VMVDGSHSPPVVGLALLATLVVIFLPVIVYFIIFTGGVATKKAQMRQIANAAKDRQKETQSVRGAAARNEAGNGAAGSVVLVGGVERA